MRAFLRDIEGNTRIIYAKKEYWEKCDCGIKTHKHSTPFEAFECWVRQYASAIGYEVVWVKER